MGRTPSCSTDRGLRWKGPWDNSTIYYAGDSISYGSSSYICINSNSGQTPPDAQYWQLLAAAGTSTSNVKQYFFGSM